MSDEATATPGRSDVWAADCAQVLACPGGVEVLLGRSLSSPPEGGPRTVQLEAQLLLDDALARELYVQLRQALAAERAGPGPAGPAADGR